LRPIETVRCTTLPAEGLVDLVDRARDGEPEQQAERRDDGQVVQGDAGRARDPVPGEPVDARAHCRGDDEAEEDERDHELQLPERERDRDHGDRDHGRDEGTAGGIAHLQAFSPCEEQCKHRWQDRSSAGPSRVAG
jgi:hypothetical protein